MDTIRSDLPGHDALAGVATDVGVEQIHRGATEREDLRDARERRDDGAQRLDVGVGETARPAGRERDGESQGGYNGAARRSGTGPMGPMGPVTVPGEGP